MQFVHAKTLIILLVACAQITLVAADEPTPDEQPNGVQLLLEYKKVLPREAFDKLVQLYSNESNTLVERERAVVNYFSSTLTKEMKDSLPVPFGFRQLSADVQEKIKSIYYQNGMDFEEKLMRIGVIVTQNMQADKLRAMTEKGNSKANMGLVQFKVNVTLTLNGFYTLDQLKQILTSEEFGKVENMLGEEGTTNTEKIGQILREAYQRNLNARERKQWPALFGTSHLSDDVKKATTYMLFDRNPSNDMTPFMNVFSHHMLNENKKPTTSQGSRKEIMGRKIRRFSRNIFDQ